MKTKKSFLWLAFLILATIWILARHNQQANYYNIKGLVFGTVYNITYQYDSDLKPEIEAELKRFDFSLSPFNDSSVISRVNRNEELVTDPAKGNFSLFSYAFLYFDEKLFLFIERINVQPIFLVR